MPVPETQSVSERIRSEIVDRGPMSFERFMDLALYAPGLGYYVRGDDPFGRRGDFFTAEQLQPVFGVLIAQFVASLRKRMGFPREFRVVEPGAGRGEMARALAEFSYAAVEALDGRLPKRITGVVFANELFDALPVGVAIRRGGAFLDRLVDVDGSGFRFVEGGKCCGPTLEYLESYYADAEEGSIIEVHSRGLDFIDLINQALDGYLLIIDYGYTAREFVRHSGGTLMSYHRHIATPDVLADPGRRDITAHVPFSVIEDRLHQRGAVVERFGTLASFLLDIGEADQFSAALRAAEEKEELRRRMQLKTLLFGMGETFRVLVARCAGGGEIG